MKKRSLPYGTQWVDAADRRSVDSVLRSGWITQGPKIKEFEESLAGYCRARYAVAVSSGTAALHVACLASGLADGDEVITTPITFAASANCALYCQATPVFADIDSDTYNIDPGEIEKKITSRTKAIIAVDLAGRPCDYSRITLLARKRNLILIEDACHALGAEYKGRKIGSLADMTVFSFHPVKSITTGEGGAILTNNKRLYERMLLLRSHGITRDPALLESCDGPWYYEMQMLGYNYRLTDMQCAMGISQLKKLEMFIRRRNEIAVRYNTAFSGVAAIRLPKTEPHIRHACHLYPILIQGRPARQRRFEVFQKLKESGLGVNVHYIPVYLQPYYRKRFGYAPGLCPAAEDYYNRAISLPIYPKMTASDVKYVIDCVQRAVRSVRE